MLAKIKKIFLSFLMPNKKTIFVLSFFILLGVLLPLYFAEAFVDALAETLVSWIANVIFTITAFIASAITIIPWLVLRFVTSPWFLDIPYATNEFVTLGWTITRDLANMFFILVLVVIALATILRIGDYQAKKALPLLIIIALLINFTPVFAGIIIDFFNVLRDFFLGEGIGIDSLFWAANGAKAGVQAAIRDFNWGDILALPLLIIGGTILIVVSNIILALIFLLYAFLFMLRPIALMMLVILSPIAFLCYVLPATRSYWTQWWNQFIQWCIIGVVAAFFLYLTDQFAHLLLHGEGELRQGVGTLTTPAEERAPGIAGLVAGFVPIYLILGFMILAFFATITTSAAGASHVINTARGAGRWTKKALAVKAGTVMATKYPKYAHRVEKFGDKWKQAGEKRGGFLGYAQRSIGTTIARGMSPLALKGEAIARKEITEKEEALRKTSQKERNIRLTSGSDKDKVYAFRASIAEGNVEKAIEAIKEGKTEEQFKGELLSIHNTAKGMEMGLEKDIEYSLPHLYEDFKIPENKLDELTKKIGSKPELAGRLHSDVYKPGTLKKPNVLIPYLRKNLQGNLHQVLISASQETRGTVVDMYQKVIDNAGGGKGGFEELVREYPVAARYLTVSTGARNLGLSLKTGMSSEEEKTTIEQVKKHLKERERSTEEIKGEIKNARNRERELIYQIQETFRTGEQDAARVPLRKEKETITERIEELEGILKEKRRSSKEAKKT